MLEMSSEHQRASVHDWDVEFLRVTAFPSQTAEFKYDDWWQKVVGIEPDTHLVQAKLMETRFQGAFEGGQLTLRLQPGRIDWLLGPPPRSEERTMEELIPSVGRFDEACPRFKELVDRWLPLSPPLSRIAFGGVVLLPVADRLTGYKRLVPYLPSVKVDAEGTRDLQYRINRRRISQTGMKDLQVNRLSTWSVGTITFKAVSITGGQPPMVLPGEQVFVCRLELDVNTAAEFSSVFVQEQLPESFNELVHLATEIIEKGDIP